MESLLHYLNKLPAGAYTDNENKKIAEYLTARTAFETLEPFLKKLNRLDNKSSAHEIGREAAKDREMLPGLGRFLRLIKYITDISNYFEFIIDVSAGGLTLEEMYVEGGLGAGALLADVLEVLTTGRNWFMQPKVLGSESYPAFFAMLYKKYPLEFVKLIDKDYHMGVSIFSAIYLYTHDPAKNNEDYTEALLIFGAAIINMSKNLDEKAAFDVVKSEAYFKKNPYISRLQKQVEKDKNDWGKADADFKLSIYHMFYFAYILSPSSSQALDLISYIFIYLSYATAFTSNLYARRLLFGMADEDFLSELLPLYEQGLYPKDRFLAYFASANVINARPDQRRASSYKETIKKLALADEEVALKAVSISEGLGGILLLNAFWQKGKYTDKTAAFEKKLVKDLLAKNTNSLIEDYFLGRSAAAPLSLPKADLSSYYLAVGAAAILSAVSPVPGRIFIYALSHKDIYWFKRCLAFMRSYRGDKAAEDFLDALDLPAGEKIAALIDSYLEEYKDEEKTWQKNQISHLTGSNTGLLEAAFRNASAKGRSFILETVYKDKADYKPEWLIECLADSSKIVRDLAVVYLTPQKQLKGQIEALVKSKTKAVRECAEKLLMVYNADSGGSENTAGDFNALAYCVQNISANAAKSLAWTEFETLPKVRMAGSETQADDRIIQGFIYILVTQTEMALPAAAVKIRESLNKEDLARLGEQLYHIWKKNKAPAKQRGVLVLAAMDCKDAFIATLKTDIQNWADSSRGALASDAVRAMALQGGNLALMTVDAISKKFSNKQVQRAGEEAFHFAAEQLGLDPEVLGDRIVPNLGFDNRGEQVIDYGSRSFIATINPSLQIDLKTSDGKALKSLPAPGVNDDQAKAAAAKETFSAMKKNLKSVASIQCLRLELALSNNRTWAKEEWTKLFVQNPIMNMFAIGLIWGVYDARGKLILSFRYMEDGSFTTVDEDEAALDDKASIGLCHPLDLGDELITAWTQQLLDYEIKQPVEQLGRKVFRLGEDKKTAVRVTEFGGAVVYAVSLLGKLQKLGWRKGSVQDAGGYYNFYKEDRKQGIGVWLNFSGTYVGADATEEVTVYDAVFYKAGAVQYGSYIYDQINEKDKLALQDVPPRLYSEVCYDIERATANRIRTDKDWEKK